MPTQTDAPIDVALTGTPARALAGASAGTLDPARAQQIARSLEAWFVASHRALPWRPADVTRRRDPYPCLVSETMLQQTQAARVAERFGTFMERFPTVHDLALAGEADVLAMWSGLGYYRRARSLHALAKRVVEEHGGCVPTARDELLRLPGIGAYTAGAVASLAGGERVAAVDANVVRVALRVLGTRCEPGSRDARVAAALVATSLAESATSPGVVNEALMELGATVCTARAPRCAGCPIAGHCRARELGLESEIPGRTRAAARRTVYVCSVLVLDESGRVLLRRRPESAHRRATGSMWGGLWEQPAVEREDRFATGREVRAMLGLRGGRLVELAEFEHATTHRLVRVRVLRCAGGSVDRPASEAGAEQRWVDRAGLDTIGISSMHRRAAMAALGNHTVSAGHARPAERARNARTVQSNGRGLSARLRRSAQR